MEVKRGPAQQGVCPFQENLEREAHCSDRHTQLPWHFTGVYALTIAKQCCVLNILAYSYTSKTGIMICFINMSIIIFFRQF